MPFNRLSRRLACLMTALVPLAIGGASAAQDQQPDAPRLTRGAVAAPQKLAADYGAQILRDGGNAIDAAVATALMLGVADGHNSGIGGGCFILIRTAEGALVAIDGRETAPALASRDMFLRDGSADPRLSTLGPLAVGTPGMLAACDLALREHGTKSLAELLRGAADVAENGFAIDEEYAARLAGEAERIRQFPATAAMLLKADGSPYAAGETLKLPDLAATYRAVADNGIDWFYRGEFAQKVDAWMRENGGALRAEDFSAYEAKQREPVVTSYRGYTVAGFPPPSSGGVHVGQILNILENFELAQMDEPARRHVMAEAMKLAFADRAHWLGDADFARVPRGLASQEYADELAGRIRLDAATAVESHGTPPAAEEDIFPQLPVSADARTGGEPEAGQDPATIGPTTSATGPATGAVAQDPATQAATTPSATRDAVSQEATQPAPREAGVLIGSYDPSRYIAPRTLHIEPRTKAIEPRTRVIRPRQVRIEPRTPEIAPRSRAIEPRMQRIEPRTASIEPRTRSIAPRQQVIAPRTRFIEPRTASIEPRQNRIEPRQYRIEPRQHRIEPRWFQPRFGPTRPMHIRLATKFGPTRHTQLQLAPKFFPTRTGQAQRAIKFPPTRPPQVQLAPKYDAARLGDSHTAHLSTADELGNFVAITSTVNTGFGSKVVVPGTGVVLNNQMDDFAAQPGVPNYFGLVGAEANAVAPGKRPLSSMSPTIILRDDEPILAIGAAGGPLIITATLQAIVNHLDLGMPLERALAAPRIHHQWSPDGLLVEETLEEPVRQRLAELGHTIDLERSGGLAVVQAVGRGADGRFNAAADPRGLGAGHVVE